MRLILLTVSALVAAILAGCARGPSDPNVPGGATTQISGVSPDLRSLQDAEGMADSVAVRNKLRARPGELLVRFKPRTSPETIQAVLSKQSLSATRSFRSIPGLRLVKLSAATSTDVAQADYAASPEVLYAEPNYIQVLQSVPDDPQFSSQWGLHNTGQTGNAADVDIDAPEGWNVTTGSSSVVVAVIDTGVDYGHEDLAANIYSNPGECTPNGLDDDGNGYVDDCHGIDTANHDSNPMDDEGHGTMVAGVIGAVGNNGVGVSGVAWNVKLLPCKFSGADGEGDTAAAIACLDYVAMMKDRGVNIVATNNSWGNTLYSQALHDAIDAQMRHGIVFVAPAGNDQEDNDQLPQYPCTYERPNVLCVSAISTFGAVARFSGYGLVTVHLGAPGVDIRTTARGNDYADFSGTSAAVPHVVGALALLKAQNPTRDWRALKNLVLAGSTQGPAYPVFLHANMLNLDRSLNCSNRPISKRMRPVFKPFVSMRISRAIGDPLELSVLHIDCAAPAGNVTLTIQPSGEIVILRDDGVGRDAAAGDGVYTANWTPTSAGTFTIGFPNADDVEVDVDPFLKPGFPVKTLHLAGSSVQGMSEYVLVGNIDADPGLELLASGFAAGPVYAWHGDGSVVSGWPPMDGWFGYAGYPVLGEYDRNRPGSEVFIGYFAMESQTASSAIYSGAGLPMPGWPKPVSSDFGSTMTADLDGDGLDEVFLGGTMRANGTPFNADLSPYPVGAYAAVADLDGDELPEVVNSQGPSGISQGFTVDAWHGDGTPVFGFPRHYVPAVTNHYPMIGDVDGDGASEIIILSQEDVPWDTSVRILAADGAEKRRIVIPVGDGNWGVHAALADLDGDGFPEIVVHGAKLYVLKGDGSNLAGWPQESGGYGPGYSAPVIGDVDGDGFPDVLAMTNPYNVSIWDRHGVPLPGFSRSDELLGSLGVPAIADIDLDGRNDIILNGAYWQGSSGIFDSIWALDLHGPAAQGPIEWGQYKGDTKHSGAYETAKNLVGEAYVAARIRGSGAVTATGIDCGTDCIQRYTKGSTVTLVAKPSAGHSFVRWRGACSGTASTCQLRVDRFRSVVAEFDDSLRLSVQLVTAGPGTVTSSPSGIACPGTCVAKFAPGAAITLTATAAADSQFIGWFDTCASTTNVCSITLHGEKQIKAGFRPARELAVTKSGTGSGTVTSETDGISCGNTCSAKFTLDTVVRLYAMPDSTSRFSGWSGACSGTANYCDVTMDQARAVTASFERLPGIIVTRSGNGHGTVTSDVAGIACGNLCSQVFSSAVTVVLTATPDGNSTFAGWGGACSGVGTCVVTTDAARDVDARFEPRFALGVTLSGAGTGSVTSTPAGINCGTDCTETYDAGTQVTLTAAANAGSTFDGWSGACTGTSDNCSVTINAAKSVGAAFRANPSGGGGSSSGGSSSSGSSGGKSGGGALDLLALATLVLLSGRRAQRALVRRGC